MGKLRIFVEKAEEKIIEIIPDFITGKKSDIEEKIYVRYGNDDIGKRVFYQKRKAVRKYIFLFFSGIIILLVMFAVSERDNSVLQYIQRPNPEEDTLELPMSVMTESNDTGTIEEHGTVTIRARSYTDEEKKRLLNNFMNEIEEKILGENETIDEISSDLNLMTKDEETGILIRWESDNPLIVGEDGKVNVSYVTESAVTVYLNAIASIGSFSADKQIEIHVLRDDAFLEQGIRRQIKDIIFDIEESDEGIEIQLPDTLKTGDKLIWKNNTTNNYGIVIIFLILLAVIVCVTANSGLSKENTKYIENIKKEFPAFIDKMILLLNAGLVVSSAMKKIASDYENAKSGQRYGFLYEEICSIQKDYDESKTSLIPKWKEFGRRTELNEIMRFCAILEDNMNKGSTLAEKLEAEGELLRRNRRKDAEEKGRTAETKMTLPMMMSLMALVLITIAPSMMDM